MNIFIKRLIKETIKREIISFGGLLFLRVHTVYSYVRAYIVL